MLNNRLSPESGNHTNITAAVKYNTEVKAV